jgi:hypothetical protein
MCVAICYFCRIALRYTSTLGIASRGRRLGRGWGGGVGERAARCGAWYLLYVRCSVDTFASKKTDTPIVRTAKTQYRKFETNIPRKGIARPQPQFPYSCVCERFIYSHNWSDYSATGKYVGRAWE